MAITDVTKLAAGDAEWQGNAQPTARYRERYHVYSDNPDESKITVLTDGRLPIMLITTFVGDATALLVAKRAERVEGIRTLWVVECEYQRPSFGGDPNGNDPTNPLGLYEVTWDSEEYEQEVYRGKLKNETTGQFASTLSAITNSAHSAYNPPLMRLISDDIAHVLMRFSGRPYWWSSYANNVVNSDYFTLDGEAYAPGTCMLRRKRLSWWQQGGDIWYREAELDIHYRRDGWTLAPLDEGWMELYQEAESGEDYLQRRVSGDDGEPVGEMVLLDGAGSKLDINVGFPHYREYKVYDELPFSLIGVR